MIDTGITGGAARVRPLDDLCHVFGACRHRQTGPGPDKPVGQAPRGHRLRPAMSEAPRNCQADTNGMSFDRVQDAAADWPRGGQRNSTTRALRVKVRPAQRRRILLPALRSSSVCESFEPFRERCPASTRPAPYAGAAVLRGGRDLKSLEQADRELGGRRIPSGLADFDCSIDLRNWPNQIENPLRAAVAKASEGLDGTTRRGKLRAT